MTRTSEATEGTGHSLDSALFVFFAVNFVGFAVMALLATDFLTNTVIDQVANSATNRNELRANYGGQFLGFAVFCIFCLRAVKHRATGYLILACVMVGLALGRLTSIAVDGPPNVFLELALGTEIVYAAICLWRYRALSTAHRSGTSPSRA